MNDSAAYSGLAQIFREQFQDPGLVIAPNLTQDDVPGWDSGAMVSIIMAIEEHFEVEFTPHELRGIRTVGDLAHLIQQHRS